MRRRSAAAGTGWAARAATRLGDASHSLYPVHSALFIALYAVPSRIVDGGRIPSTACAALLVVASVVAVTIAVRGRCRHLTMDRGGHTARIACR